MTAGDSYGAFSAAADRCAAGVLELQQAALPEQVHPTISNRRSMGSLRLFMLLVCPFFFLALPASNQSEIAFEKQRQLAQHGLLLGSMTIALGEP